jgi:hypothetical protein
MGKEGELHSKFTINFNDFSNLNFTVIFKACASSWIRAWLLRRPTMRKMERNDSRWRIQAAFAHFRDTCSSNGCPPGKSVLPYCS